MKRLKPFLQILIATASVFPLYRFCHKQTDGFAVRKIRKAFVDQKIPHLSSNPSELDLRQVKRILKQPLKYIGRGGQCYAFATSDDQYVVKLLKYNNNYPRPWFRLFPFPSKLEMYRQEQLTKKHEKLKKEYESYQIALQDLREETGIVYVHLDAGALQNVQLEIFDKINMHYILPADTFQFYIQKKGTPFYPELKEMFTAGNLENMQKALDEMTFYLIKRCQKKIIDKDDGIWRNFAFYQGHPFQIDIGQFVQDSSLLSEKDYQANLISFTKDFRSWLKTLDPSLEEHFMKALSSSESSL